MRTVRTAALSSATTSPVIPADTHGFLGATVAVIMSAGASMTAKVQYTVDDVSSSTFDPSTATWFDMSGMTALAASAAGGLASPVTGIRLNVTAYTSGTASMTVVSANAIGA